MTSKSEVLDHLIKIIRKNKSKLPELSYTSKLFKNVSKVNQHKMVYDALEGKMGGILHALSINSTLTVLCSRYSHW